MTKLTMRFTRLFPRTLQDRSAFFFLVTCVICVYFFELFIVLPKLGCYLSALWYIQSVCGLYMLCNILGNLLLMIRNDSSTTKLILPSKLQPGWKFCSACESNSPPRSFHCNVCNVCVLRRDHHCTFAGCCVGFNNTRYFMALLLHLFVGCMYAAVLNTVCIWSTMENFQAKTAVMYIFPFIFWFLGYVDTKTTIWSFLSVVSILGGLFAGVLLYVHTVQTLKNQTSYEKNTSKVTKYDLGWRRNLVETMGTQWTLVWLWPGIPSKLPSDGIHFLSQSEYLLRANKHK